MFNLNAQVSQAPRKLTRNDIKCILAFVKYATLLNLCLGAAFQNEISNAHVSSDYSYASTHN